MRGGGDGGTRSGEDWRGERRRHQGSRTRGRGGGARGNLGPLDGRGVDEAGQVWNKLGKEEDGCEEGLQGGDVSLKAKESVWGKGRKSAGMEAAAQRVAMGLGWRPPSPPGWDSGAGLLGGSQGSPKSWSRKKVGLIWAISERREAETIAEGPGSLIE